MGGLAFAGSFMYPLYIKLVGAPTITSVETTNFEIYNINFPAVTICSNNKIISNRLTFATSYNEPWRSMNTTAENILTAAKMMLFFGEDASLILIFFNIDIY
jgi:hypothetical protein